MEKGIEQRVTNESAKEKSLFYLVYSNSATFFRIKFTLMSSIG
jgi:hypothetical protein